jgi:hypothetical protein
VPVISPEYTVSMVKEFLNPSKMPVNTNCMIIESNIGRYKLINTESFSLKIFLKTVTITLTHIAIVKVF